MAYEEADLESIHNMFEDNSDADKDYQPNYGDLTSSGQNRNIKTALFLSYALQNHPTLEVINQKFFIPGHSFDICDIDFGVIERSKHYHEEVYVPEKWERVIADECTRDNSKEAESFREQFNTRSAEYVEEILSPHFGGILQFVKEGEVLVDKGQADELKNHETTEKKSEEEQCERVENLQPLYMMTLYFKSLAVTSWSQTSCLRLTLRNACWFESSWGKKFSHEISASVWDRCPPSIVIHSGSYDRKSIGTCSVFLYGMETIFGGVESRDPVFISQFGDWFLTSAVGSHPVGTVLSPFPKIINTKCSCAADEYSSHQGGAKEIQDKFLKIYYGLL
ncbi:hypothetical protein ANN_18485 [Periplaneta americana]|uniref:Uncharacterized protein n=1 Tax=Periplaneta americana TaxID=6978 RepID=A0ABQ8SNX1_PERAM|nr:hypothetical protein ANN_18485 [Periplaneta americana]